MEIDGIEFKCAMCKRYTSDRMREIFSEKQKIETWRFLWSELAECERIVGVEGISEEQVEELRQNITKIDIKMADEYEKKFKHDVMAHIHAYGDVAPSAKGIIHLGATSEFVKDNADIIIFRKACVEIISKLYDIIKRLRELSSEWKDTPALGFTHLQPAQLTTVGKRFALYCQSFIFDAKEMQNLMESLVLRGVKGAIGSQASFLKLLDNDSEKVEKLESLFSSRIGVGVQRLSGQTYDRKIDSKMCSVLAGIGSTIHKMCNDIRILAHKREVEESFGKLQVGSSAMPYKQNPMKCERATAISRFIIQSQTNAYQTAAEQWFERTLDDSANRRLNLSQNLILTDYILVLSLEILNGIRIYPKMIEKHVREDLPFIATENIIMEGSKLGLDRQVLHEKLRQHCVRCIDGMKNNGSENTLVSLIENDEFFKGISISAVLDPLKYIGRSIDQVDLFIKEDVDPFLSEYQGNSK